MLLGNNIGCDGKDVEKVAIGAVLGIGGMLALRGLFSFIARD